MASFTVDVTGDREVAAKLDDLGGQLNRWGYGRAFRPAAYSFLPPLATKMNRLTGRLRAKTRVRAIKKTRTMVGVTAMSQFGTTEVDNDPYYGAFVNWGHGMGPRSLGPSRKRTKQYRFEESAFWANLDNAIRLAGIGVRDIVTAIWAGKQTTGSET